MRQLPTWVRVATATIAAGALLAGCSNSADSEHGASSSDVRTVKVGITSVTGPPTFLPLLASKFGLDTQHGLKVEFETLTPNVTAQSLMTGAVDVLAAPSVETAILQGAPLKIFAGAAQTYWHFVASNNIRDWSDLKGKNIAIACGQAATCHSYIENILDAHGVSPDDVTFVYGTAQGTFGSLSSGAVDAALTTPPYTYVLEQAGATKEFDISDFSPYLGTQYTATSSFIDANSDTIEAFASMLVDAEKMISNLPISDDVVNTIENYERENGIDPSTLDQRRFLTEFAEGSSWQIVPTRALIDTDLAMLKQIPDLASAAENASFDQLVHKLSLFEEQYG